MKDESPPMLAIYLLLAFLSLQYASNLFNTNQFVYERKDAELQKLHDQLTQIQQVLVKPEVQKAEPESKPNPAPKPPVVVKKKHNKISQSEEPRANRLLPASATAPVRNFNE